MDYSLPPQPRPPLYRLHRRQARLALKASSIDHHPRLLTTPTRSSPQSRLPLHRRRMQSLSQTSRPPTQILVSEQSASAVTSCRNGSAGRSSRATARRESPPAQPSSTASHCACGSSSAASRRPTRPSYPWRHLFQRRRRPLAVALIPSDPLPRLHQR